MASLFVAFVAFSGSFTWAAAVKRAPTSTATSAACLPTVDLTYALHRATVNTTGNYYNFSNIAFAAPPVGNLRFAAPIAPTTVNRTVNDGQQGSVCAQAQPYWAEVASYAVSGSDAATISYVASQVASAESALTIATVPQADGRASEDCLHLDVIVPQSIYNKKSAKAPVLVWIYGGGYVNGDKTSTGNPATLIANSQLNGGEGVVYVAMNYRLGLFGWLSGSTFNKEGGLSNAALYDQRLALDWVQKYIHLFGGDPTRVTVMGESAGAGSIMHHITAYGGAGLAAPKFSQAILQSPGFSPVSGDAQQVATFNSVLTQAQTLISPSITDVKSLRALDFTTLAGLNSIVVARSAPYGTFTFGPTVDGVYVPDVPGKLLAENKFTSSIKVMVGHNSNEGAAFASPFLATDSDVRGNLASIFPTASNGTLDYMMNTVWPAVYDGTYPYTTVTQRVMVITSDISFTCNTRYLDVAFKNKTWSYYFAVPPGFHGEDIPYTFFNGDTSTLDDGLAVIPSIATALQTYITNFATTKTPNGRGMPWFPQYGKNATVLEFGLGGVGALSKDNTANSRCDWLMGAYYE